MTSKQNGNSDLLDGLRYLWIWCLVLSMEIEPHPFLKRVAVVSIEDARERVFLQNTFDTTSPAADTLMAAWLSTKANHEYPMRVLLTAKQLRRAADVVLALQFQAAGRASALDETTRGVCDAIISFAQGHLTQQDS